MEASTEEATLRTRAAPDQFCRRRILFLRVFPLEQHQLIWGIERDKREHALWLWRRQRMGPAPQSPIRVERQRQHGQPVLAAHTLPVPPRSRTRPRSCMPIASSRAQAQAEAPTAARRPGTARARQAWVRAAQATSRARARREWATIHVQEVLDTTQAGSVAHRSAPQPVRVLCWRPARREGRGGEGPSPLRARSTAG